MAGNSGAIRAGAAFVEIFADKSALMCGLKAAEQSIKKWGQSISSFGKKMMGLGTAIVAPLITIATKTADFLHELEEMSIVTGIAAESLYALSYAADQNGVSMQGLVKSMIFMHKNLFAVQKGSKSAVEAFGRLGLSAKDLAGKTPDQQFLLIADRIASIKDPTLRAALALKVFGRSGAMLLPLLSQGSGAIRAYQAELKRLGATVSSEDIQAAAGFYKEVKKLWWVVKNGLIQSIGSALIPMLRQWAEKMVECVGAATRWVKENRGVVSMVFWFGIALTTAGGALYAFGSGLIWISKVVGLVHAGFAVVRSALLWLVSPIGMVIAAVTAAVAAFLYFSGYGGQLMAWLGKCFASLKDDAINAFNGISKALAKGDLGLAARIAWLFVKVEWLKAKQWLLEIWYSVKEKMLEVWLAAVYGIVDAWYTTVYGIQVAWIETVAFLKSVWIGFKEFWGNTIDWIAKKMMDVWIWWQKLMDPNFDENFARAYANDQFDRDQNQRAEQTNKDLLAVDQERARRRRDSRLLYDDQMKTSEQMQQDEIERANDLARQNIKNVGDELAKTKRQFDESIRKANEPAQPRSKKPPAPSRDWSPSGLDKASTTGTFSAFGLNQMGVGSGLMQKISDYTQRTAEATEEIADQMADGGLEFGN
ncbi:hypothetical protein ACQ9LF_08995 [Anaerohalosphaeraceae bacterium U12dextr]|jgi:hypothetical protein